MSDFEDKRDEWIHDHGATDLTQHLHHVFEAAENRIAELEAELAEKYNTTYRRDAVDITLKSLTERAEQAENMCAAAVYRAAVHLSLLKKAERDVAILEAVGDSAVYPVIRRAADANKAKLEADIERLRDVANELYVANRISWRERQRFYAEQGGE